MGEKKDYLHRLKSSVGNERIVHIGNSLSSDVETALDAGVEVVYLPDSEWRRTSNDPPAAVENPDVYVFDSIESFLREINEILNLPQRSRST